MGTTRYVTATGLFVRERLMVRIWEAIRGLMGRRARDWQPMVACIRCQAQIEQRAAFCVCCGASQIPQAVLLPQTEAIRRLPSPKRQTEALKTPASEIETKHLYRVRLGERHPTQQRLVERRLYNWLYMQIESLYRDGATLVIASQAHGTEQYIWLLAQLKERESLQLIEAFTWRCKAENVTPFAAILPRKVATYGRPAGTN